jgi:hypothetical protein
LPHVRFTRDRRGYENTFVVHRARSHGDRPTILYWFRTPPDIRVGRSALDEEAIGALEAEYPGIRFDWSRLQAAASAESAAAPGDGPRQGGPNPRHPPGRRQLPRGRRRQSERAAGEGPDAERSDRQEQPPGPPAAAAEQHPAAEPVSEAETPPEASE